MFSCPEISFCPSPLDNSALDLVATARSKRTLFSSDSGCDSSCDSGCVLWPGVRVRRTIVWNPSLTANSGSGRMSIIVYEFNCIPAPDCCPPRRPFRPEDRTVLGRGYGSDKYSFKRPVVAGITARAGDGETRRVSRHLPATSHRVGIPAIYFVSLFNQGSLWGNVKTTVLVGTRMIIWHIVANVHKYKYRADLKTVICLRVKPAIRSSVFP